MNILFICHANLCRSVLAQVLLKKYMPQATVWSCGLYANPQQHLPQFVEKYLSQQGLSASHIKPIQLTEQDLKQADWIFCMEPQQLEQLTDQYAPYIDKMWLLNEFVYGEETAIQDPMGLEEKAFFKQASLLEQTIEKCAQKLRSGSAKLVQV
ncbi:MAG: hypothetical protein IKN49_05545 [Elusimicrobiaceae bacterium]|nr:hypothetical protein [Elusimicrobiaceae bacterium]